MLDSVATLEVVMLATTAGAAVVYFARSTAHTMAERYLDMATRGADATHNQVGRTRGEVGVRSEESRRNRRCYMGRLTGLACG